MTNTAARPLRRTIQNLLEDKLAEAVLDHKVRKNALVEVGLEGEDLSFSVKKKAVPAEKVGFRRNKKAGFRK